MLPLHTKKKRGLSDAQTACATFHKLARTGANDGGSNLTMAPRQQDVSPVLLHPCRQIQQALGVGMTTVYWWAKHYGLPIFHLPNGHIATTVGLLEAWAKEMRAEELARGPVYKRDGKPSARKYGIENIPSRAGRSGARMEMVG